MRTLIVATCAKEETSGELTVDGIKEVHNLIGLLRPSIHRYPSHILSSRSIRAQHTAEVFAERLAIDAKDFHVHDLLCTGNDGHADGTLQDFATILSLVKDYETVILVAHYAYVAGFPHYVGQKYLAANFQGGPLPPACAWVIDCQTKKLQRVINTLHSSRQRAKQPS